MKRALSWTGQSDGAMKGWIGVDLDGTLAFYDGWKGPEHIGEPISLMVGRVKDWIAAGHEIRIFTARVSHDGTDARIAEAIAATHAIADWCITHIGIELPVTNVKDYAMIELWDDRCVQVEENTGIALGKSCRGLR